MEELASALPWVAFWIVAGLYVWLSHQQFMAGYDTWLFTHDTDEEKRLREAIIKKREKDAAL